MDVVRSHLPLSAAAGWRSATAAGRPGSGRRSRHGSRGLVADFDDLFGRIGSLPESTFGGVLPTAEVWAPLADVSETDDAYPVEANLPGVKRDDIDLELSEREPAITG